MRSRSKVLQIRIKEGEKEGFELAASLAGISLSSWVRERLRLNAIRELEGAGRRVPFIPEIKIDHAQLEDAYGGPPAVTSGEPEPGSGELLPQPLQKDSVGNIKDGPFTEIGPSEFHKRLVASKESELKPLQNDTVEAPKSGPKVKPMTGGDWGA